MRYAEPLKPVQMATIPASEVQNLRAGGRMEKVQPRTELLSQLASPLLGIRVVRNLPWRVVTTPRSIGSVVGTQLFRGGHRPGEQDSAALASQDLLLLLFGNRSDRMQSLRAAGWTDRVPQLSHRPKQ